MATYQLAWNATTKVAKIQEDGSTPGTGFTDIGNFVHDHDDDLLGDSSHNDPAVDNHTFYHHVRDLLYHVGVYDMQSVSITYDFIDLIGISVSPATVTLAAAATQQLTVTYDPTDANNTTVAYTTSDATKATVSGSGLITAVATGTATITVTSEDGEFTDTCVVTIS